jgi:hypothetical protein
MSRSALAIRLLCAFLIGGACAFSLLPLVAGPTVQRLRLERDEARGRAETLEAEVSKLKVALQRKQSAPTVRHVSLVVDGPDHRVVVEAERRLTKELTEQYAGRPIEDISPFLLTRRVQGELLTIDGVRYQLKVELVVLGPEIALYGVLAPLKG